MEFPDDDPECTIDNFLYRSALLHAFFTSIDYDSEDVMSYEIINNVLHDKYFYTAFLESIELMSYILREEVTRWQYSTFKNIILNNDIVPQLLFHSYHKCKELLETDDINKEQLCIDMNNLFV